jgi:hypothetical protein
MNGPLRLAVVVTTVAPLAACLLGLRFACGPANFGELMRQARHAEELQELQRATFRRLDSRRRVMQELIDRRCSLVEALRWFGELDHEWPDYTTPSSKVLRQVGLSDEERRYRHITAMVQDLLGERPEEAAAALRRLEEDYRQLRAGRQGPGTAPTGPR